MLIEIFSPLINLSTFMMDQSHTEMKIPFLLSRKIPKSTSQLKTSDSSNSKMSCLKTRLTSTALWLKTRAKAPLIHIMLIMSTIQNGMRLSKHQVLSKKLEILSKKLKIELKHLNMEVEMNSKKLK